MSTDSNNVTPVADLQELKSLAERSDRAGFMQLAGHVGLLALTTWWINAVRPGAIMFVALMTQGIVLVFLFAPAHETIHKTAFRSGWLNTAVGWVSGLILLLPPKFFRAFHLAHHRYTQVDGSDPELATAKPSTLTGYLWHISGVPYWTGQVWTIIRAAMGKTAPMYVSASRHRSVVEEARVFAGIYLALLVVSIAADSDLLWRCWLLPVLLGQPFLRWFLLAEHTLCPRVEDMYANTRTTLTNPLVRFLCWNMSFHTEHHVHAGIPFHRLPEAHRVLKPRIGNMGRGYTKVNVEILAAILSSRGARESV